MAIVKHTAPPATAEEIRRAVGVTEEDRKVVDRVLAELGFTSSPGRAAGGPRRLSTAQKAAQALKDTAAHRAKAARKAAKKSPTPRKSK